MNAVAAQPHVTLSGDINGDYIVTDRQPGGTLTLVPDTSWRAILARGGARELTSEEWDDFLTKHGPHMQPPDGEG